MEVSYFDDNLELFIRGLEKPTISKVLRLVDLLEDFGSTLGMPHSKKISQRLFELRARGKQEVRVFYTFHRNRAVLLHGFIKKTEKTPPREIQAAIDNMSLLD